LVDAAAESAADGSAADASAADASAPAAGQPDAAAPTTGSAGTQAPGLRDAGAQADTSAATASVEVKVPDIGDFKDVEVIEVLVQPGDRVEAEQSLITVESDKASMEIPSSAAGEIAELRVKVGDKVNEGSLIAVLKAAGAAT